MGCCGVIVDEWILEILIPWLESHRDDIADGINDFGDLKPVYEAFFPRKRLGS